MTVTQTLVKLKKRLMIMIIVTSILLLKNLISLMSENFAARLKQANLTSTSDIADFVKKKNHILMINLKT